MELHDHSRPAWRPALPWLVFGIVLLSLNLRTPIISPTAILPTIQADTGLSSAGAGLLTGLPVLLFALSTPLATRIIRRRGIESAIILCLVGIIIGTVVRSTGPVSLVLAGSALLGIAITLGNIVVPVLIRRDVPSKHVTTMTGVYSAAMNVGSMATLLTTAPLAAAVGWQWALAFWSLLALAALVFWCIWQRRVPSDPEADTQSMPQVTPDDAAPPKKDRRMSAIVVLLAVAFTGQSGSYYAVTTWLPGILSDTIGLSESSSSATASLFQISALFGAFLVPILGLRFQKTWVPIAVIGTLWMSLPLGLLLAPQLYILWAIIGGVAQGGGFTAIFSIIPRISRSSTQAASASAKVQAGGYLAATFTPPIAGWLHTLTSVWTVPLLFVLVLTMLFCAGSLTAAKLADRR